jgi:hypothetical protein
MFDAPAAISQVENLTGSELETAWRVWARREQIKRFAFKASQYLKALIYVAEFVPAYEYTTEKCPHCYITSTITISSTTITTPVIKSHVFSE